jgi:phospholipase/carboxylesterase
METSSLEHQNDPTHPRWPDGSRSSCAVRSGLTRVNAPAGAGMMVAMASLASGLAACRRPTAPLGGGAARAAARVAEQDAEHEVILAAGPLDAPIPALGPMGGLTVRTTGERAQPRQVVVLLHGWGASGEDLVPLGEALAAPGRLLVFPEAPLAGPWGGRAWWHLDLVALEAARASGQDRDLRATVPVGLPAARASILALLDELEQRTRLPRSAVILGGFSQGAMLAVDAALASQPHPGALVVLSGTLVAEAEWTAALAAARPPIPVFMSHGRVDPVLPFRLAEALRERVAAAGHPVTWVPFGGGHEIPRAVLAALASFLPRP